MGCRLRDRAGRYHAGRYHERRKESRHRRTGGDYWFPHCYRKERSDAGRHRQRGPVPRMRLSRGVRNNGWSKTEYARACKRSKSGYSLC